MGVGELHSKKIGKHSAHLQFQACFDGLVVWKYYQKTVDFKSLNTQRMGMLQFFLKLKYILRKKKLKYILRKIIQKKYFGILAGC